MPQTGNRDDPFLAFRFVIKIDGMPAVGGFSECSGLQMETEVLDFAEGGVNDHLHKFPTRTKQTNVTLKRGVVDQQIWQWYFDLTQGKVQYRNGAIHVKDPSGAQDVMVWQFRYAFPCKFIGPDLNAMQSNIAVETFELAHQGLVRAL